MAFNVLGSFAFMVQGLRQSIAMCLCLWALECLKRKHWIKSILLILLASTFHASALVFFIILPLIRLKLNAKGLVIFLIALVLVVFLLPNLFELVNLWIDDDYSLNQGSESGGVVAILIYFTIIAFGFLFGDKNEKFFPLYIYLAVIATTCMIMRNTVSTIVERVAQYFAFGQMAILGNSTKKISNPATRSIICMTICSLMFAVAVYKTSYSVLFPYEFFWNNPVF
jgi:hypothetical protein